MKKKLTATFLAMFLLFTFGMLTHAASVTMNKNSATIQIGETCQLQALVNGTAQSAYWGSSDTSVATVSSSGLVTGKAAGSSVITAMVDGTTVECIVSVVKKTTSENARYNVLILDASGSMRGTPLKRVKEAAKRFSKAVLNSAGKNYLAVVTLSSSSKTVCKFTDDLSTLNKCIDKITANGGTNMNSALKQAGTLLASAPTGNKVMKNIILCSDGLPKDGSKSTSGRYTKSNHKNYAYANAAYKTDVSLKNKGYFVYALGFFHNSSGKDLTFGKKLMKDLASKDKYFIVTKPADIDKVFTNIAADITKTTINKSSITLYVGETYKLKAMVDGKTKTAKWKTSKKAVATVNTSGKITAKKAGTATITGTVNGQSVTCKVTVKKKKTTASIKLNKSTATVYVGKSITLKATVKGDSQKVTWSTSDKSIATVKNGKVTGVAPGTVTITAKANGKTAKCKVTVKKASASIKLNKSSASVYVGNSITLKATVTGSSQKVTWKTSDKSVATVKNGVVTGKSYGTVTISATANGKTAKCKVKVLVKHPEYSQYFMIEPTKSKYGSETINEYGVRLKVNDEAIVEKCAVYIEQNGSIVKRTIACTGTNITSAYYVPYLAYNGKILYEGSTGWNAKINAYSLSRNYEGIWSRYNRGYYGLITADLQDSKGKDLAVQSTGVSGKNTKIFYDKNEMIKWLRE